MPEFIMREGDEFVSKDFDTYAAEIFGDYMFATAYKVEIKENIRKVHNALVKGHMDLEFSVYKSYFFDYEGERYLTASGISLSSLCTELGDNMDNVDTIMAGVELVSEIDCDIDMTHLSKGEFKMTITSDTTVDDIEDVVAEKLGGSKEDYDFVILYRYPERTHIVLPMRFPDQPSRPFHQIVLNGSEIVAMTMKDATARNVKVDKISKERVEKLHSGA